MQWKRKKIKTLFLNIVLAKPILQEVFYNEHFYKCKLSYDSLCSSTLRCWLNSYTWYTCHLISCSLFWVIRLQTKSANNWRILKNTLTSGRSQSEKATYYTIPTIWHSGKSRFIEIVPELLVTRLSGVGRRGWIDGHRGFRVVKLRCMIQ